MDVSSLQSTQNQFDYTLRSVVGASVDTLSVQNSAKLESTSQSTNLINSQVSLSRLLGQSIQNISSLQKSQVLLSEQSKIATTVLNIANTVPQGVQLDAQYNDLQDLASTYNENSSVVYKNINDLIEEVHSEKSRIYFDGVPGALPLSAQEIAKEAEAQLKNIEATQENIKQAMQQITQNSMKTITEQKKPEVADIDFKIETQQFQTQRFKQIKANLSASSSSGAQSEDFQMFA
ncbi:MAG: hypothetical protein IE909_02415 [Campylobacterales bacterium]|nr:hypothetical protein [Campylobacterales bacterium]